jgi:hypothetical protein
MSDQEEQMGEVIVTANNKSWFKELLLSPKWFGKFQEQMQESKIF